MEEADLLERIGAEGPPVGVVGVGGDQGVVQGGRAADGHHHRRVAEHVPVETELGKIPRLQLFQLRGNTERAGAGL